MDKKEKNKTADKQENDHIIVSQGAALSSEEMNYWRNLFSTLDSIFPSGKLSLIVHTPNISILMFGSFALFMIVKGDDPGGPFTLNVRVSAPPEIMAHCVARLARHLDFSVGEVFEIGEDNILLMEAEATSYFVENVARFWRNLQTNDDQTH